MNAWSRVTRLLPGMALMVLFASAVHALDPAYLAEWPPVDRVLADHQGEDRQDTLARQMAALHHLHRAVEDMADTRRWHGLTADEDQLRGQYWAAAERIRDEVNATLPNELSPGFHGPFAKPPLQEWYALQWKYERDPAVRARTLGRYLSPPLLAQLGARKSASDARAAEAGRELLEGLGASRDGAAPSYLLPLAGIVGLAGLIVLLRRRGKARAAEAPPARPAEPRPLVDAAADEVFDSLGPYIAAAAELTDRERVPIMAFSSPFMLGFVMGYCRAALVAVAGGEHNESDETRVYQRLMQDPRMNALIDWHVPPGEDVAADRDMTIVNSGSFAADIILRVFRGEDIDVREEFDQPLSQAVDQNGAAQLAVDMPATRLHPPGPYAVKGQRMLMLFPDAGTGEAHSGTRLNEHGTLLEDSRRGPAPWCMMWTSRGGGMSGSDRIESTSLGEKRKGARLRLRHWLRVAATLEHDPRAETIRAVVLAVLVGMGFALLGTIRHFAVTDTLGHSPVELDLSLRALSHGWFESDRTIPVTIVDIDEATQQAWGSPAITPRRELTRLMEVVTRARPAAVVVDIDLSFGGTDGGTGDERVLRDFLMQYPGSAPLVFPKRIEPAPDGTHRMAASPLDDVFESNARLAWAHASFETGGGGAVHGWQPWLAVCSAGEALWLPSVATRLAALLDPLPPGLHRPVVPSVPGNACHSRETTAPQRLLVGPRLTGAGQAPPRTDAQAVSALLVLDPEIARDDARLFGGRVVLIGSTHASAGDFWLTPSGVLPGVELLANTIRYAPLQDSEQGGRARLAYRLTALLLFACVVFAEWRLRGLAALVVSTACVLASVAAALALFGYLGVFDAVEAAILLVIVYKALETGLGFIEHFKAKRRRFSPGLNGWFQTLLATCLREHDPHPEGH